MRTGRLGLLAAWLIWPTTVLAEPRLPEAPGPVIGPFNAAFLAGGAGVAKPVPPGARAVGANAPFTLTAWVDGSFPAKGETVLVAVGRPGQAQMRALGVEAGRLYASLGGRRLATGRRRFGAGRHHVAMSFDGARLRLYQDGEEVASAEAVFPAVPPPTPTGLHDEENNPLLEIAPRGAEAGDNQHFAGRVGGVALYDRSLDAGELRAAARQPPDWRLTRFEAGSKPWPVQLRQQAGYDAPQDPSTLPVSKSGPPQPHAIAPYAGPALVADKDGALAIRGGWRLVAAPALNGATGAQISSAAFDAGGWLPAVVPGTALTTLVARGVYPDPAYGLNNMVIPETLNQQDYWYRAVVDAPPGFKGRNVELLFDGVNYAGEVWLNGERLGDMKGAFIRGRFAVGAGGGGGGRLRPGQPNVIAVRVSPPPHPGIPQEESIKAGPGENGGLQMLDGPTFVATEGWDWIPAVRDRNTGLWQDVKLKATGCVRIEDPQVVTTLPLPDRSRAEVTVSVTLRNLCDAPVEGVIRADFDRVAIRRAVTLAPGAASVRLAPDDYAELRVANPRLWWPNGYGEPALHDLRLAFDTGGAPSDAVSLRFGIREITYELSAFDAQGRLRRVEVDPAKAGGRPLIDGDHAHIHLTRRDAFAVSLHPGALGAPGLRLLPDDPLSPFLVIKVNGVRIAARGGAWGMDDFMKRVAPERLEPYFKLNAAAHMNILRNWVGQDTEEALYDLADKYGILVWNDFWESTQDYNLETDQEDLFLNNAADVVTRFRNHPSIAIWIGRNEGMTQLSLNLALEDLTRRLDGTRYYAGSSNRINLQDSGPYSYREPADYFTTLARGFAVEVGTPAFSTLESFKSAVAPPDRWPIGDVWAYHDWHQSGNGDVHGFEAAMAVKFGAPTSLEDFERKAQMLQYESYRAIFEGLNANLWTLNSGRMLWMTQPAWPSNHWQIYNHDYDTGGPFYGTMKGAEPVHVQLNLPDFRLQVTNTTLQPLSGLRLRARVATLQNRVLIDQAETVAVAADAVALAPRLDLDPLMAAGPVLVELELSDGAGRLVSRNFYWEAARAADLRQLDGLPMAPVRLTLADEGAAVDGGDERRLTATLTNTGPAAALQAKLTLVNPDGSRILPALYDDNYVSLLPGETRAVRIAYPASVAHGRPEVWLRGYNVTPTTASAP